MSPSLDRMGRHDAQQEERDPTEEISMRPLLRCKARIDGQHERCQKWRWHRSLHFHHDSNGAAMWWWSGAESVPFTPPEPLGPGVWPGLAEEWPDPDAPWIWAGYEDEDPS